MRTLQPLCFGVFFLMLLTASLRAEPLEVDCLIEPHVHVKIGSPVPGVLDTVNVDRGDMVKKNQVLATLRSGVERSNMELAKARAEMEGDIEESKARLAYTDRKQQRMQELHSKQAVSFENLDEAQVNRVLADIALKRAVESKTLAELDYRRTVEVLKKMTIYSPINGVVVDRFQSPGEYVEDQPVLQVAQIDPLNVEVILSVENRGSLSEGMTASVVPQEPVGGTYQATVTIVDKVVDAASGTFGVRLEMPNPGYRINAGIQCKVIFDIGDVGRN